MGVAGREGRPQGARGRPLRTPDAQGVPPPPRLWLSRGMDPTGTCRPKVMDSAAVPPSRVTPAPWWTSGTCWSLCCLPTRAGGRCQGQEPFFMGETCSVSTAPPRARPACGVPGRADPPPIRCLAWAPPAATWGSSGLGGRSSLGRTAPTTCVPLGPSGAGGSPELPASLLQAPRGPDHPPRCHHTRRGQPPAPTRTNAAHSSLPLPWLQSKLCLWGQFLVSGVPPKGHLLPHLLSANVRRAGAAKLTVCSDFCHLFCCPGHMGLPSPCGWDSF